MGFINVAERTINAKLVYYGVGVGGKTTSLQQVHGILCPRNEVQLVSINTEEDSTLLFDFLPINLGQVGGFKIRIQGFTVPGQPKYRRMRKLVLQGADAVVLVVDSQRSRAQENAEALQSMRENLRTSTGTSEDIPIVVQYNKRDLPDILEESELDRTFRFRPDIATFPSVATDGQGVFEAFVEAVSRLVERKVVLYGLGRGQGAPHEVADGVRQKLWAICDEVRRSRSAVPVADLPQARVALVDGPAEATGPAADAAAAGDKDLPLSAFSLAGAEVAADKAPAEDEFELSYTLRDSAGATAPVGGGKVLSDEELQFDLQPGLVVEAPTDVVAPEEEAESGLLDKTLQSNVELAQRYGDLDEQRLLLEHKVQDLVEATQQTVHDLNRPLSAMRLMLATIDKGYLGEVTPGVKQAVQNGLLACSQMERLVRDLLDSSRLDHDGVQLQFVDCNLDQLLASVLETLRYEITDKSAKVEILPLPVVRADSWALTKVFMNLLGNALIYGRADAPLQVTVFAEERGDEWLLAVRDNGIGIPEPDRKRLFRRFERGSNTGGISGTGLGLHIVREIVQGHGGTVSFDSAVGQGTTFWLHLPKSPVQAKHSPTSGVAARHDL